MKIPITFQIAALVAAMAFPAAAQVNISSGTYTQDFDSLANSGTANPWTDNGTLTGWYAAKALPTPGGPIAAYRAGTGSDTAGALYSFGSSGSTERALGSVGSGSPGTQAYGVRFVNDTANGQTNITISFTGEQWRNSANAAVHTLAFSYRVDSAEIIDPDAGNVGTWTPVPELSFNSPTVGGTAGALNGNDIANQQSLVATLVGVVLLPGQELFLRWVDIDNSGSDHGFAIDNLSVSFQATTATAQPPSFISQPEDQTVVHGNTAVFSVQAGGTAPLAYQWYFNSNPVDNGTTATLTLPFVSTNQAGTYYVTVSNSAGTTNSESATLTVTIPTVIETNIAYLRTLMDGNFAPANTTNLYAVQGTVVTFVNMTDINNAQFYIDDGTGGIAVFVGGGTQRPAAGDLVRVVGPLGHFNGLFELNLVNANPTHSVETIGTAALPSPEVFQFANASNTGLMESSYEGSLVVVSNVYLQNAGSLITANGMNILMTNLMGQTFTMRVDSRISDAVAQTIPTFASSITGVMGQFDQSSPYTTGYQLLIRSYSDIVEGTPLPPVVVLEVVRNGSNIEISWPETAAGTLQGTPSLNTIDWQPVVETPVTANGKQTVTIPAVNAHRFFRLLQQ